MIPESTPLVIQDCWNQIGVRGNRHCEQLRTVIHCHYCPTYIQTSRLLLKQSPSLLDRQEWTQVIAQPKVEAVVGHCSVVLFRLGSTHLALPTHIVQEIITARKPYRIPHCNNPIFKGLINLNGRLQPCVSLGRLLQVDKQQDTAPQERLLVMNREQRIITFYTSHIMGVHRYHPDQLQPAPAHLSTAMTQFTLGLLPWGEQHIVCLHGERLFDFLESQLHV